METEIGRNLRRVRPIGLLATIYFALLLKVTDGGSCPVILKEARISCLDQHLNQTQLACESAGCCWDETSDNAETKCYAKECKLGFFGWQCKFQSHCSGGANASYNRYAGECEHGCSPGRWGVGCLLDNNCTYNDPYGINYTGKRSRTDDNQPCKSWSSQSQYKQFPDRDITAAENYCRNPSHSGKTWCNSESSGWDWCTLRECECPEGRFGINCVSECHCQNGDYCHSATGICSSGRCDVHWSGNNCQECSDGYFGTYCEFNCRCNSSTEVCNKRTGNCASGCALGWKGQDCQKEVCGYLTTGPENKVAFEGEQINMKCRTNETNVMVIWNSAAADKTPQEIFNGTTCSDGFLHIYQVNRSSPEQYDLIINASLSTGKQYICQGGSPFCQEIDNLRSAELIVLAAEPNCTTSIPPDGNNSIFLRQDLSIEFNCTITYKGNWEPTTDWRKYNSTDVVYAGVNKTIQEGDVNRVISSLSITFDPNNNVMRYIYQLHFDESKRPSATTAQNVPGYTFNWTSPTIFMEENNEVPFEGDVQKILWPVLAIFVVIVILMLILLGLLFQKRKNKQRRIALDVIQEAVSGGCYNEPVYAAVKDTGKRTTGSSEYLQESNQTTSLGLYSLAHNPGSVEESCIYSNAAYHLAQSDSRESSTVIGADGTEYAQLQVKSNKTADVIHSAVPKRELYETCEYAYIDHTG